MGTKDNSAKSSLEQGASAFSKAWTRHKMYKTPIYSTQKLRKDDLHLSLMHWTCWNRPSKKGAKTIAEWVAAEVSDTRLDERKKNLRHPHIRFVRQFIVDTIIDHNVRIARLSKSTRDEINEIRDEPFEWWDQIKPCPPHEINAENVDKIARDYELDVNWKADNDIMAKLGVILYQGLLTNNPQAPPKDRVLATAIAEHVKEILDVSRFLHPLHPSSDRFFANATTAQSPRPQHRSSAQTPGTTCQQEDSCGKGRDQVLVHRSGTASDAPPLHSRRSPHSQCRSLWIRGRRGRRGRRRR
jgi:hypothetical protein